MEMAPGKRDQDMGFRLQRDGLPVYRVQFDIFEVSLFVNVFIYSILSKETRGAMRLIM